MLTAKRHRNVRSARRPSGRREGIVLVVVLVVVMMLALGTYTFTRLMTAELSATDTYERESQARALADSGIELAAAVLGETVEDSLATDVYDNPQLFRGVLVNDAEQPRRRSRFSIVAPLAPDEGSGVRFGLVDESSKLNLNTLVTYDVDDETLVNSLMQLRGMTYDVAAAILDWIDDDDLPRSGGAEAEYYGSLSPPIEPRNGPIDSLDELLHVRGVTRELLYGEDANRNGLLDPEENDGAVNLPMDNADGVLDLGWAPYLTVVSREANRRADGTPRINVNGDDLPALYDELVTEFDEDTARFVVAYRMNGSNSSSSSSSGTGAQGGQSQGGQSGGSQSQGSSGQQGGGQQSGGRSGSGQSGGGQSSGGAQSGGSQSGSSQGSSSQQGGGQSGSGGQGGNGSTRTETRGGLAIPSSGGAVTISSLYDLIGATVQAQVSGVSKQLDSPWSDNVSSLGESLAKMLDVLTTTDAETIPGRINVAEAPREVIAAIPEISDELIPVLLGAQAGSGGAYANDPLHVSAGWLLVDGHVELEEMRTLDRYITGRGGVYRVQAVGHFDAGGPVVRSEAMIDATALPPQVLWVRDLSNLGPGYTPQQLTGGSGTW